MLERIHYTTSTTVILLRNRIFFTVIIDFVYKICNNAKKGVKRMLKKFTVKNFKSFKSELVLDFSQSNYEYNANAVKNGIINTGIIYGHNGCGKSNLGLAIFDLVMHLTDKQKMFEKYQAYLNLNSDENCAFFEYVFYFLGKELVYSYTKVDPQVLLTEKLVIDGEIVVEYDFINDEGYSKLDGTQTLKINSPDSKLSKLKFIKNNAYLADNDINNAFTMFMDYVDRMLLFFSLDGNGYQGFSLGTDNLDESIIKSGKLKDFEKFLHRAEINEKLISQNINGREVIMFDYKNGTVPFSVAASRGTSSLELFYYWYIKMSQASFVFIDEFDAFYHFELSELIVKELLNLDNIQLLLTTHNTDLLSNDLLRPDCYFKLEGGRINSLSNLTRKELRKAHNIQKMYKAGAFNE